MKQVVTILGARGSVPVSGKQYSRYGGATTCALFESGGRFIVLDAGTGLLSLPQKVLRQSPLPLLLTHPHADHLLGLPICPYVMTKGAKLDVYAKPRGAMNAQGQIARLMSPPLWPVGPEDLPADIGFHDLPEKLLFGNIRVSVLEGRHPGGVSVFRIEAEKRSVVLATDCTLTDSFAESLTEFAHGCDLLLCDGQFSEDEWEACSTYGHSTWNMAAQLAQRCGARQLRIIHHSPFRTDAELDLAAKALHAVDPAFDFAKEGEKIEL